MTQLRMFQSGPPWENRKVCGEPRLWVKELVIFQDISHEDFEVVRRITFRRGLNVIWTPNDSSLAMTGHTAGKSLLVNFLRSLLSGEQIPEFVQLRQAYPEGGIGAVIVLNGKEWHTLKPFRLGETGGATSLGGFEDILPDTWHVFTEGLAKLTANEGVSGLDLLPWLMRDQRTRFANIWLWQAGEVKSANHDVIARILRIQHPEVEGLQRQIGLLTQRNTTTKTGKDRSLQKIRFFRSELRFDNESAPTESVDFDFLKRMKELEGQISEVENKRKSLETDSLLPAERDLAITLSDLKQIQTYREGLLAAIENRKIEVRDNEIKSTSPYKHLLEPGRHICSMPLVRARGHCPLLDGEDIVPIGYQANKRQKIETVKDAKEEILKFEAQKMEYEATISQLEREAAEFRRAVWAHRNRTNLERDRLSGELAEYAAELRLLQRLSDEESKFRNLETQFGETQAEIKALKQRIELLETERKVALQNFAEVFDHVVKFVVGEQSGGEVRREAGVLEVDILQDVVRSSVAIDSLKVPLFDIAALIHSLLGHGALPTFLIHDSIREADLAEDIYHRIFKLLHLLESQTVAPDFQYIILTTTPPPPDLRNAPYIRAQLAAFPAEKRLCATNF